MLTWWVIGIVAAIYAVYFALYFFKKKNVNTGAKSIPAKAAVSAENFQNELNSVADLAVKKIEDKILYLESLMNDAQEKSDQLEAKIKVLDELVAKVEMLTDKYQADSFVESPTAQSRNNSFSNISILSTAKGNADKAILDNDEGGIRADNTEDEDIYIDEEIINNDKHRMALEMSRKGYSPMDIAKLTGLGKGEVMLIRQLYSKKR